jgi:hypothetical protein
LGSGVNLSHGFANYRRQIAGITLIVIVISIWLSHG